MTGPGGEQVFAAPPSRRLRPVSLVGMPGGGKSSVGRHLARRLGCDFQDLDALIEAQIGCTIRAYFEFEGEARFREVEAACLARTLPAATGVLATGGGTVLDPASRALLRAHGVCVYLASTPDELHRRLRRDVQRPLLQVDDPLQRLRELHAVRDPLYREAAHHVFDTGRPSVAAVAEKIVQHLERADPRLVAR